jgi:hypothetical protein
MDESSTAIAWDTTISAWPPADPLLSADAPTGVAIDRAPTTLATSAVVHPAFRRTRDEWSAPREKQMRRLSIVYDSARDLRSFPVRNAQRLIAAAPEIGLLPQSDRTTRLFREPPDNGQEHPVLAYFDNRADLNGLPVLRGADRLQAGERAGDFADTGRKLRAACGDAASHMTNYYRGNWRAELCAALAKLPPQQTAPLLLQMLQCEQPALRRILLEYARSDPRPETTRILAQRAVYETDAALRREAVLALAGRTPDAARPLLLAALKHPWPFVADQAASALIVLNDQEAVPELIGLLDEPDPTRPITGENGARLVREVVRVNHARNCQLCHAPSWNQNDTARVSVPSPLESLPPSFSVQYYTQGNLLVRADVTYLRQDFSMTLPVADPGPWPAEQRFDFFVRTRPARPDENGRRQGANWHRAGAVRALRAITGKNLGDTAEDWRAGLAAAR